MCYILWSISSPFGLRKYGWIEMMFLKILSTLSSSKGQIIRGSRWLCLFSIAFVCVFRCGHSYDFTIITITRGVWGFLYDKGCYLDPARKAVHQEHRAFLPHTGAKSWGICQQTHAPTWARDVNSGETASCPLSKEWDITVIIMNVTFALRL